MPDSWFYVHSGNSELEQGDVIDGVEIYLPPAVCDFTVGGTGFDVRKETVIVITQSCDLANPSDHKGNKQPVPRVLVCPVYTIEAVQAIEPSLKQSKMLEQIRINFNRNYFMLGPSKATQELGVRLVSLREPCVLPRETLEEIVGDNDRDRLYPPMREALGQAFGLQFNRVAIDTRFEIPPFVEPKGNHCSQLEGLLRQMPAEDRNPILDRYHAELPTTIANKEKWAQQRAERKGQSK